MIENGGGQIGMLNQHKFLPQRHGCGNNGTRRFESVHYLHGDEGLILDDEDRAASKLAGHWGARGAAKRVLPEAGGDLFNGRTVSRAVDQSSTPQQA
jgi:hypothetical protein